MSLVRWSDPGVDVHSTGAYSGGSPTGISYVYRGGFIPNWKWQQFGGGLTIANLHADSLSPGSASNCNAETYGATGWKKFRPGNPTADLGVFVGEIREVPKMLKDTAIGFRDAWKSFGGTWNNKSRALSNHWLSTQFGWLPFVSDLRKFYRTYQTINAQLERIRRYNGQWQKRGGSIVDSSDTTLVGSSSIYSGHWPALVTALYNSPQGSYAAVLHSTTRVWFEGSFRYWIPNIDTPLWSARAVAELYGALPNPALIWELTPFSWLVDWCSNLGDILSNMDTGWADNLAAKYAYVMKSTEVTGEFSSFCNLRGGLLHDCWTFPISWKSRAGASRFGFSLTESEFSVRQWSILAALGIQKYSR